MVTCYRIDKIILGMINDYGKGDYVTNYKNWMLFIEQAEKNLKG